MGEGVPGMWATLGLRVVIVYQPTQKHFSVLTSGTDVSVPILHHP